MVLFMGEERTEEPFFSQRGAVNSGAMLNKSAARRCSFGGQLLNRRQTRSLRNENLITYPNSTGLKPRPESSKDRVWESY